MARIFIEPEAIDSSGNSDIITFLATNVYMSNKSSDIETEINTLKGYFNNDSAKTAEKLKTARNINLSGAISASTTFDGSSDIDLAVSSIDATKLTGIVPLVSMPKGALERMVVVKDDTIRYALTADQVQIGDLVKVTDTKKVWYVKDESNLNSDDGYEEFPVGTAASVPWGGITDKPTTFTPESHTHTPTEVGVIDTAPTNGQVAVFDGTTGKIKSTGYTIAKSVPSNALFTDSKATVYRTENNIGTNNDTYYLCFFKNPSSSHYDVLNELDIDMNYMFNSTYGLLSFGKGFIIGDAKIEYNSDTDTITIDSI